MNQKKICVIANGYAEEMIASMVMSCIREELKKKGVLEEYQFVGGSLVSSGKWYHNEKFATFFTGGVTPSGGFPTRSLKGFFADLGAGAFLTPFVFSNMIKKWSRYNLDAVIVVGDFLLMMLAVPAIKKSNIPLVFIPTAKSDYVRSHFKIEKYFIKKYAFISFPRDRLTTDDFIGYGINSRFEGNLIQDLLNPNAKLISSQDPVVSLLPGSREEAYGNLDMMIRIIPEIPHKVHWALVQASSLDAKKIEEVFLVNQWEQISAKNNITVWQRDTHQVYCYPNTEFDSIAFSCIFGVSLAGTASEQIAGLGKPVIGFTGTGPQSSSSRMSEYEKLLGNAFIYEKSYPHGVKERISELIINKADRERRGKDGQQHMGDSGASRNIANYIIDNILKK